MRLLLSWALYAAGHGIYLAQFAFPESWSRVHTIINDAYQALMRWSDRIGGKQGPWG